MHQPSIPALSSFIIDIHTLDHPSVTINNCKAFYLIHNTNIYSFICLLCFVWNVMMIFNRCQCLTNDQSTSLYISLSITCTYIVSMCMCDAFHVYVMYCVVCDIQPRLVQQPITKWKGSRLLLTFLFILIHMMVVYCIWLYQYINTWMYIICVCMYCISIHECQYISCQCIHWLITNAMQYNTIQYNALFFWHVQQNNVTKSTTSLSRIESNWIRLSRINSNTNSPCSPWLVNQIEWRKKRNDVHFVVLLLRVYICVVISLCVYTLFSHISHLISHLIYILIYYTYIYQP